MDDEIVVSRPIFGDVFGDRGDYTKGAFYASRRTFLISDDDAEITHDYDKITIPPTLMIPMNAENPPKKSRSGGDQIIEVFLLTIINDKTSFNTLPPII